MPVCSLCSEVVRDPSALFSHYEFVHRKKKSDSFKCGEKNCSRARANWYSFKQHLLSHGNEIFEHRSEQRKVPSTNVPMTPATEIESQNISKDSEVEVSSASCLPITDVAEIQSEYEQLLLEHVAKLYANPRLPRSLVLKILKDSAELHSKFISLIKPVISHSILTSPAADVILEVEDVLDMCLKPYSSVSSEHLSFKALRNTGCFIESIDYGVGERVDDIIRGGRSEKVLKEVLAKCLPMRDVLHKLFSLPGVFTKINSYMNELHHEQNVMENFVQGELWRRKVRCHFQGKTVFPLFVYFDDFEVNNPLGAHATVQKLGAVYYSIPCIPPEVRSLVDNIFLALLFHTSDRKMYRNERIFEILIDEINFLQREGIWIDTEDGEKRIYFALGLVLGDNLGLNQILGFVEGFSGNAYCRLCTMSKWEARRDFREKKLRKHTYYEDVGLPANVRGIKELSVWNRIDHFETAENFVADWLHEGPEGTVKEVMVNILYYYVFVMEPKKDRLSLDVFNSRLKSFNYYGNDLSNVPPVISHEELSKKKIKMSASELQNFTLIFAFLASDLVPCDDAFKLYLKTRKIMDIVLSRRLQKQCSVILRTLVEEHHQMFKRLFPDVEIKPKGHLWIHYGTVLDESGPIVNLSSIRFESKHKEKKKEANATTSRKNITHTLCLKEQLNLCHRFMIGRGLNRVVERGPSETIQDVSSCNFLNSIKDKLPVSFLNSCVRLNWVKVHGQIYKKRLCVLIRVEDKDELLPEFGIVKEILQNQDGVVCLICDLLFTTGFDSSLHAFKLYKSKSIECILVNDLHSPFPVIYINTKRGCYGTLRHGL